jgi:hypothetical protein
VFDLVERLINAGRAVAVLGNHEVNLLREDSKDGAGWYFDDRVERDQPKYAPFTRPSAEERARIRAFVSTLPIALEREDLRVVHAAWIQQHIDAARDVAVEAFRETYDAFEQLAHDKAERTGLGQRMQAEIEHWPWGVENRDRKPPFLHARAEHEVNKQTLNALKVLTCGVERTGQEPFYAGGKWRFVERMAWWDAYDHPTPVVVGHYWRTLNPTEQASVGNANVGKANTDLFEDISPLHWHGKNHNVFCADFSVGGRWAARKAGSSGHEHYKLAALRWPERVLQFDDGSQEETLGFRSPNMG